MQEEPFVWTKHWYPLAVVEDLNPQKPFATKLLGKDLVIWQDADKQWRCFEDICPHRLAPLSQGRIEPSDGSLQCSYHGWRFGGSGAAIAIPQAAHDSPQSERTSLASKRSCVATYPVQVQLGLVWVWPESGPHAFIESSAEQPALNQRVKEVAPEDVALTTNQNFVRDFPVAYDILFENISDQARHCHYTLTSFASMFLLWTVLSHLASQWANHFEVTNLNKDKGPGDAYTYDLEWSPDAIKPPINQKVKGVPPAYIEYFTPKEDGKFTALWFYVIPLDEHSTRVINHAVVVQPLPKLVKVLAAARPRWIDHLLLNEIFDGDMAYLAQASANSKRRDGFGNSWAQDYYLPARADGSVLGWRKWYHKQGGGGFWEASGREATPAPVLTREQLLDRYHQHTQNCPACSKALQQLRTGRKQLLGLAAALLLAAAAQLGRGAPPISVAAAAPVLGALASVWLSEKFAGWQAKFVYSDYDHTARD
ncbi:Rieske-domain-containing protein [Coccomyxa subellipsoidea C-169]|uniref:Rieske-domain-containing protein n=1 Tax=Coccomyxa subellipsoidea (strain C-169) TaxID=574566 RepID=I0YXU8_COCSC|nr:Rieske-domain-containing protein [Coccomyxa subellipsoidea C-169]EIE23217.1 Rieske-domain-containing protein [Coccomyxa subellipsoidea C-169]|eukprot:XP_005647761.1 Rieske-domain-containing protein [Coccomyxa subellipsoidea C-169]